MRCRDLIRELIRRGWSIVRVNGSHRTMRHNDGRILILSYGDRDTIPQGSLRKVCKHAGENIAA